MSLFSSSFIRKEQALEKRNRPIPVIQYGDLPGVHICNGCGTHGLVQQFTLRISDTGQQTMAWCSQCAEKVALYLIPKRRGSP